MNEKIDFNNLGFTYRDLPYRFVSFFKNGQWEKGSLITDSNILLNECACVFQYAQTCFEGLKAYRTKNNEIVTFRPELNAERFQQTCKRLVMPTVPTQVFIDAVDSVVRANEEYVPPFDSGATLYVRPFMMGINPTIGLKPSTEYMFRVFAIPVGSYFKNGMRVCISEFDRAAPNGTGQVKAGLNYAMSLYAGEVAHEKGFDDCIFLDSKTRTFIEETKGANVIFISKNGSLVTPKSNSILPSITRRSLIKVAEDLGIHCEERQIKLDEIENFVECGFCGTAAVISTVKSITVNEKEINFNENGKVIKKLYDALLGMQRGLIPSPKGWIHKIR